MSASLSQDEKHCPFCAEVIKAAAIKCRYCQSIFAQSTPSGEAPLVNASKVEAISTTPSHSTAHRDKDSVWPATNFSLGTGSAGDIATAARQPYVPNDSSPSSVAVATPPVVEASGEIVYLEDNFVKITSTRAIISGKTYSMANVTSVVKREEAPNYGPAILATVIGILVFLCSLGTQSPLGIFLGLIIGGIGIATCFGLKPSYWVRIGSASSEANAFSSQDEIYINRVVEAVNHAIIDRG